MNVVPEGQMSITQRELEVIFDGVKCITNNKGVLDFELYDESRYFLLEDNYTEILEFLNLPFREIEEKTLSKYRFESHIYKMLQEHE